MDRNEFAKGAGSIDGGKEKTPVVEIIVPVIHRRVHLAEANRIITIKFIPNANSLQRELLVTVFRCLKGPLREERPTPAIAC